MKTTSEIVKVLERVLENFNMADIKEDNGAPFAAEEHRMTARQMLENLYNDLRQKEVEESLKSH